MDRLRSEHTHSRSNLPCEPSLGDANVDHLSLYNNKKYSDVIVHVVYKVEEEELEEGEVGEDKSVTFRAHKVILCSYSKHFRAMLDGKFKVFFSAYAM